MGTSQEKVVLIIEKEVNSSPDVRDWAFRNPLVPVLVSSAVEALIWLGKGNLPNLILAEAGMQQMNGPHFVRTLQSSGFFHDIPLIVFGYPDQHAIMAEMRQAGAVDHIFLPAKPDDLASRFNPYLRTEELIA
jgi:CheY-like chemotaxis protein